MTDLGDRQLERRAGFVKHLAGLVEDREAARSALVVAFVGNHETVVVQPLQGIRLACNSFQLAGELQRTVRLGVDAVEIDRAGGEVGLHFARLAVDDDDVVVLLQRQGDFAEAVDGDEFRLRIVTGYIGKTGHVDMLDRTAIRYAVLQRDDRQVAGRHLRDFAVVEILVALVLDRNCREALVSGDGNRVWLAAQVATGFDRLRCDIDDDELARRLHEAFGRVDGDQNLGTGNGNGCGFAIHHQCTGSLRRLGIGDVDKADAAERAVGIDQRIAVLGRGDDLGRCRRQLFLVGRQVGSDGERRDAVEDRIGRRGKCSGSKQCRSQCGAYGNSHGKPSCP